MGQFATTSLEHVHQPNGGVNVTLKRGTRSRIDQSQQDGNESDTSQGAS